MKLLADEPFDIIGTIEPPISVMPQDPEAAFASLISLGIKIFLLVCGIAVLIMLLWGAFDWITSGGDKEKLSKAQKKLTNAVIGILVVIVAFVIFGLVVGDILGIVKRTETGWQFYLPGL